MSNAAPSVTVLPDGEGHSAFLVRDGEMVRLSPTWLRDTFTEYATPLPVGPKGKGGKVLRMVPHKTGQRVKCGESRWAATNRAVQALKLIALGRGDEIRIPKEKYAHD